MNILAIELSTYRGSIAILSDGNVASQQLWDARAPTRQNLFLLLIDSFRSLKMSPEQIDLITVGLGPGSFSGIRIALATAFAFTLPDHKPVFGISSSAVIASEIMSEIKQNKSVVVIGDARRNQLWLARFRLSRLYNSTCIPETELEHCLVKPDALSTMVNNDNIIVTPDIERIGSLLMKELTSHPGFLNTARLPSARTLGELTYAKIKLGLPGEPLKPLYMHPPVVIR
jgi:tRNA threonylcarbamoyl adenosine modification protein YeaZ